MKNISLNSFRLGQKLRMTKDGIAQRLGPRGRMDQGCTGKLLAIKPPLAVKVLRDGTKTPAWYHADFWEAAT